VSAASGEPVHCERKACRAPLPSPRWWNTSTRAFYCDTCKAKISRFAENDALFEDRASKTSGEPEVIVYDVRGEGPMPEGSYVTEAAYLTLAQQRDATERLCAQHEGKIHELRDLLAACAQQRDAAVRERDKLANWKRETESFSRTFLGFGMTHDNESVWSAMGGANQNYSYYVGQCEQLQAENESLRARLAACERVGEAAIGLLEAKGREAMGRADARLAAVTYQYRASLRINRSATAQGASVDDDDGPNDGHARTVNRTPPQDAATTRGEPCR
jgi:hypothetical protein